MQVEKKIVRALSKIVCALLVGLTNMAAVSAESFVIDSQFGKNGRAIPEMPAKAAISATAAVFAKNRIYVVGDHAVDGEVLALQSIAGKVDFNMAGKRIGVTALKLDGALDRSYAKSGHEIWRSKDMPDIRVRTVAASADGFYALADAEFENDQKRTPFSLVKFDADGGRDKSFGEDGVLPLQFLGRADSAYALAVKSDGTVFIGGYAEIKSPANTSKHVYAVLAIDRNGQRVKSFGKDGLATMNPPIDDIHQDISDIQFDANGSLIMAASAKGKKVKNRCAIVKLMPDGKPDTGFGRAGLVVLDSLGYAGCSRTRVNEKAIYVLGDRYLGEEGDRHSAFVAKLSLQGKLDASFGAGGYVTLMPPSKDKSAVESSALVLLPGGKIVAVVEAERGSTDKDWHLVALNDDGKPALLFSGKSSLEIDIASGSFDVPRALYLDAAGALYAVGYTAIDGGEFRSAVVKLKRSD
jgi:uncharacterized delta-60 repeat protein